MIHLFASAFWSLLRWNNDGRTGFDNNCQLLNQLAPDESIIAVYEYAVRSVNGRCRNLEHLKWERLKANHIGYRRKHYEFQIWH